MLIAAFVRALKDPFPPGRNAGLLSLAATQHFHTPMDAAARVLPAVAPLALDPEREVRETALACVRTYVAKLEQASANFGKPAAECASSEPEINTGNAAADQVLAGMSWLSKSITSAVVQSGGVAGTLALAWRP